MNLRAISALSVCVALASCRSTPNTAPTRVDVPSASPVATATASNTATPAPVANELKLPEGSYLAAVVRGATVRFSSWVVRADGRIRATEETRSALDANAEGASIDIPIRLDGLEREAPFAVKEECPGGGCRSAAGMHGRLTLPGEQERPIRLQSYGDQVEPRASFVLASVDKDAPFAVVLDSILRSPAGPWLAPAIGDLDGDGVVDVAFVAMGVGTCGGDATPECPVLWLDVLMSSTDAVWETDRRGILARNEDLARMTVKLGQDPCLDSVRWVPKIESGAYVAEAIGPKGSLAWGLSLRAGQLSVRPR